VTDLVDPGWKPALPAVVPFVGSRLIQGQPFVITLRALWLTFCGVVVFVAVVVTAMASGSHTGSVPLAFGALAVAACIEAGGIVWARRHRTKTDPQLDSAGAYRTLLFQQIAFSELTALVGFVFALVEGRAWIYYVGAALTLVGFVVSAPTRRVIAAQGATARVAFLTPPGG
jgi:drug/metabolite transporter (DMT)-like permease